MELKRYPFVIDRRKSVIVTASTLSNALDRVLYKHPNKFIKTTYARNVAKHQKTMDLINAQKEAKQKSKATKDTLVYVILEEDEFLIKNFDEVKPKDDVYSIWKNGTKYEDTKEDLKAEMKINKDETKTENKMETKEKKAPKKAAKKVAKKATKKVAKKLTPKTARAFTPGKLVSISIKDMRANMKKGLYYRDPQGVIQTEKYMATRAKQDHVRDGMHEYKVDKTKKA